MDSKNSPNLPRPVRIVANIRKNTPEESTKPWIIIRKPEQSNASQGVSISFAEHSTRKDSYELDYCYEQNEGNSVVYLKELEPFIAEVFNGKDLTVIAYGARRSGKTYTIKGTEDDPGLAMLAMGEILSKAEEIGYSVSISMYEVCDEHVVDVLDANRTEVQVLEDAQGKVNLKGLSKVVVKSMEEFSNLFSSRISAQKEGHHNPPEPKRRPHKGLMVYLSWFDDNNRKITSKMNFVDLAGYEDSRRNNEDGLQVTKINKSLYGLFNVVHAINANENRVPYRETKLTRLLKEPLTRNNQILMVTCLNPSFCQDTIHTLSLASRSCQNKNQTLMDSKGIGSASKLESLSSTRRERPTTPLLFAKEQTGSNHPTASKKASSISKERERPATPLLYAKEHTGSNQPSASKKTTLISKERERPTTPLLFAKEQTGSNQPSASKKTTLVSKERERPTTPLLFSKEQTGSNIPSASKKASSISKERERPAIPFLYSKEQTGSNQPSASKKTTSISKEMERPTTPLLVAKEQTSSNQPSASKKASSISKGREGPATPFLYAKEQTGSNQPSALKKTFSISKERERPTTPLLSAKEQTGNNHPSASKKASSISKGRERPATPFSYAKEQTGSKQPSASKITTSISKERRTRNDVKPIKLEQLKSPLESGFAIKCKPMSRITPSRILLQEKDIRASNDPTPFTSLEKALEVIPFSSSETLLGEEHGFHVNNDLIPYTSLEKGLDMVACVIPSVVNGEKDVIVCQDGQFISVQNDTSQEKEIDMVACLIPSGVNSEKDVFVCQDGKENISSQMIGTESPPLSEQIKKISENLKALYASTPSSLKPLVAQVNTGDYVEPTPPATEHVQVEDRFEPKTPATEHRVHIDDRCDPKTPATEHHVKVEDRFETPINYTPSKLFQQRSSGMKQSLVQEYLKFLNTASKEELKGLKGIGEKRSTYILELRETSPEPFKKLDDLEDIGLSAKQIKGIMRSMAGTLFS